VAAEACSRIVARNHRLWKFEPGDLGLGRFRGINVGNGRQRQRGLDRLVDGRLGDGRPRQWRYDRNRERGNDRHGRSSDRRNLDGGTR
jgi:hypothetical protein